MNDERLVRDMWKELPHREVVGHRLGARVGARGWVRARFGLFRRFFARCGLPDPWDPAAPTVEVGLGEVGVAAPRRAPAPHAAPPGYGASTAPKGPNLPNLPPGPRPGAAPKPPVDGGRPAPRLGESRKDDTAVLKQKSAEAEKAKANPIRANLFKVNQPVVKLPMRPDVGADGAAASGASAPVVRSSGSAPPPRPAAPASPATRPSLTAPPTAAPPRPGGRTGPSRMAIEPTRRASLPDGPEEIEERAPVAARASAYAGFGMDGAWEDDPDERARAEAAERQTAEPSLRVPAPPPQPPLASPVSPPAPAAAAPSPPRPSPPGPARPRAAGGGLDDLFGMGASGGENTRVRMPKREEADPAKPRRPMVTPDADLKGGAIDRRPPPPKLPGGLPARAAPGAPDPEGDGGD